MGHRYAALAFTPGVKDIQRQKGSRASYSSMEQGEDYNHELSEREASFIAARDSFYMASVSETGWPYVQHRGGPRGFMKVIDRNTIAFAEYSGNRQYVSKGNLTADNRVSLFFMDYPNQRRLKILGRVGVIDPGKAQALAQLSDPDYLAEIEHGFFIHVEAFDWNCPQHITPRFTVEEFDTGIVDAKPHQAPIKTDETPAEVLGAGPLALTVSGLRQLTTSIRSIELTSSNNTPLPVAEAGAHIKLPVRNQRGELVDREYSITSQSRDLRTYEIAVARDQNGRGGSDAIHRHYEMGTQLRVNKPLNLFALHADDRPSVLIAGGIGITPIRAMAYTLQSQARPFSMYYTAKNRDNMAFANELEASLGQTLTLHSSDTKDRLDIQALLTRAPRSAVIYVCGPDTLTLAVTNAAKALGFKSEQIRFERFQ